MSELTIKKLPFVDEKPSLGQQKLSWIQNGEILEGGYNGDKGGSLNELPDQLYQNIKTIDENFVAIVDNTNQQNADIESLKHYVGDTTNMDLVQKVESLVESNETAAVKIQQIDELSLQNTSSINDINSEIGTINPQDGTFRDIRNDLYYIKTNIGNNAGFDINGVESDNNPASGLKRIVHDVATSANQSERRITEIENSIEVGKSNLFRSNKIYNKGDVVRLDNGMEVISLYDGNLDNPNGSMENWKYSFNSDNILLNGASISKYLRYITPDVFGIIDSVDIDQYKKLQDMIYFSTNNNISIIGTRITCAVSSQIVIPPTLNAHWNGFKIKMHSDFSGGTGSLVVLQKGLSTPTWQKGNPLDSIVIEGSSGNNPDPNLTLDGLYIGGSDIQTSDLYIPNIKITGFRDCLNFKGKSTYLLTFFSAQIGAANRRGIVYSATTDSGENIKFFGGSVFNCINSSNNGTGVYNDPISSTLDIIFDGVSFDYSNISAEITQSKFTFNNCHFENNNNNPHIIMRSTSGKSRTTLIMKGGNLGGGPGGIAPFEDVDGRNCYIELFGSSMNIDIDSVECGGFKPNGQKTEIVKNTGGLTQRRIRIKPIIDAGSEVVSSVPCAITNSQNLFYVEQNGSLTGWLQQGSWSSDISEKSKYDTGSRKLTTSNGSGNIAQEFSCKYGDSIIVKNNIKLLGVTQGYAAIRLQFYNSNNNLILDTISPRRITADFDDFKEVSWYGQTPNGATKVKIYACYVTGLNNDTVNVWSSGERAWIF